MLKAYADAHVVLGLVQALRQRGMDVVRVQDRGREQADDADLFEEALVDERMILTNDTDFLVLAAERGARQERFARVITFWMGWYGLSVTLNGQNGVADRVE